MPKPPLDPSIIDKIPLGEALTESQNVDEALQWETLVFTLQAELDESQAEVARLTGSQTVEQVRAQMLKPYADKVFNFVMIYCGIVGIMLISAGNESTTGFELSDTILAIIAGSTAVSVIGLIGMVISGLFGPFRSN